MQERNKMYEDTKSRIREEMRKIRDEERARREVKRELDQEDREREEKIFQQKFANFLNTGQLPMPKPIEDRINDLEMAMDGSAELMHELDITVETLKEMVIKIVNRGEQ
jgi:hypothetical protein